MSTFTDREAPFAAESTAATSSASTTRDSSLRRTSVSPAPSSSIATRRWIRSSAVRGDSEGATRAGSAASQATSGAAALTRAKTLTSSLLGGENVLESLDAQLARGLRVDRVHRGRGGRDRREARDPARDGEGA